MQSNAAKITFGLVSLVYGISLTFTILGQTRLDGIVGTLLIFIGLWFLLED